MALYLDTEFNGFKGELISLALFNVDGNHFYEVLELPADYCVHPWVKANVVPVLNKKWCTSMFLRHSLINYLNNQNHDNLIYAD